jgi:DNA-binding winged helix-turn-helix (wHTH) protein/TolB-like protein
VASLVYEFREFELDPAERRLTGAGGPIALTPKVFDTLVLLVQRGGHLVTKDELMKALWPRGYVEESNLTKHIWVIRRALGDGETDSRFIETVPKVGYRFIAPVTTRTAGAESPARPAEAPAADAGANAPQASAPQVSAQQVAAARTASPPERSHPWYLHPGTIALAAVVLLGALYMSYRLSTQPAAAARPAGRTVAVVGFTNLTRSAKDQWLAAALSEMVGAELSVSTEVQVLPDELVRDASAGLAAAGAGGYSLPTLERLRRRLDADYVVSGSYLVSGSSDSAPLRVDIALQDARNGALLGSVSSQSGVASLLPLVTQAGVTLREKLGVRSPDAETLGLVAKAQPPSLEIARRMGFALEALEQYDAARARDELLDTVAQAPGYAPAHMLLAQAWSALGYRDKAVAAAEQAARFAGDLPPDKRLQVEATLAGARADFPKAAAAWASLAERRPSSRDYRLRLIEADLAGAENAAAQAALTQLRDLRGAADDPRTEIAAAHVARERSDAQDDATHAGAALASARRRDSRGLMADAEVELGRAERILGQHADARVTLTAAITDYRSVRNPRGEADARRALAGELFDESHAQESREEYQQALALEQSIGDQGGAALVYRDLCQMMWLSGDRDGAQAAAQNGLKLARETGDLGSQSWTLRALATIASDDAASDEVLGEYREVVALNERTHDPGGLAWSLAAYADIQRLRGELDAADHTCARARAQAAPLSDPQFAEFSDLTCAQVAIDRGEAQAAESALRALVPRASAAGYALNADNARLMLAGLAMDRRDWGSARALLEQASRGMAAGEAETGEADAQAMLALCDQALGITAERDRARERARELRRGITARQEVYGVDITLARLANSPRDEPATVATLLELAADAERRHFLSWSLEAKMAAWQLLHSQGASERATALRREIEGEARQYGYGRILHLLHAAPVSASPAVAG